MLGDASSSNSAEDGNGNGANTTRFSACTADAHRTRNGRSVERSGGYGASMVAHMAREVLAKYFWGVRIGTSDVRLQHLLAV